MMRKASKVSRKKKLSQDEKEEKILLKAIKNIHIEARKRAFEHGASVTYIENGQIIRENPDGNKELIGVVPKKHINIPKNTQFII
jgi:hypothetical protein